MSLAEGILWLMGLAFAGWGVRTVMLAGGRGGSRKQSTAATTRSAGRPAWHAKALGVSLIVVGGLIGLGAYKVRTWASTPDPSGLEFMTPWRMGPIGVIVIGAVTLAIWRRGRSAKGQPRCHRCWHDLTGVPKENNSTTCPECGNVMPRERDLLRPKRRRVVLALGVLLVSSGGVVLYHSARTDTFRMQLLVPNTVLRRMYTWSDTAPSRWVTMEIRERFKDDQEFMGRPLLRRLVDRAMKGESVTFKSIGFSYITRWVDGLEVGDVPLTLEEFEMLWLAATEQCAAKMEAADPAEARFAHGYWSTYHNMFKALMKKHGEVPQSIRDSDRPTPALIFSAPDYPPKVSAYVNQELRRVNVGMGSSILSVVDARLNDERVEIALAAPADWVGKDRELGSLASSMTGWYTRSERAKRGVLDLLISEDPKEFEWAFRLVERGIQNGRIQMDDRLAERLGHVLSPPREDSGGGLMLYSDPEIVAEFDERFLGRVFQVLLESEVDPSWYASGVLEWAPDSEFHAKSVFAIYVRAPELVWFEDLQRLADSDYREVKHQLIQRWRSVESLDPEGVRGLIETLRNDPDWLVADAAKRALER